MSYCYQPSKAEQLIKFSMLVVVSAYLAWQSRYVYESYKIRQRVAEGLKLATLAKAVVEVNASMGVPLDEGWESPASSDGVVISIAQTNGVITIRYGVNVDGGGRSLNLVPILSGNSGEYAYKGDAISSTNLIPVASQVSWVCVSADTMTRNLAVLEQKGTLPAKYAPLECRF